MVWPIRSIVPQLSQAELRRYLVSGIRYWFNIERKKVITQVQSSKVHGSRLTDENCTVLRYRKVARCA